MKPTPSRNEAFNTISAAGLAALLDGLIDYAGLFPPAGLEVNSAIETYFQFLCGPYAQMGGRFVLPWTRFNEFLTAVDRSEREYAVGFRLSVLHSVAEPSVLDSIVALNDQRGRRSGSAVTIDAVEFKPVSAQKIVDAAPRVPSSIDSYYEIPLDAESVECIAAIKEAGARAKIRTGGLTTDSIPPPHEVASCILACAKAEVPFKATAGLHHPIRSLRPLTYEPDAPRASMHGFINLFLAAALVYCGGSHRDALDTLEETDPTAFQFDGLGVRWHKTELSASDIKKSRKHFAISFGSCSLSDPLDGLKTLGWLKQL
jgi:hypothetical protein